MVAPRSTTAQPQPGLRMNVSHAGPGHVLRYAERVDYLKRIPHHEGISYWLQTRRVHRSVEAAPEGVEVAMVKDGMLAAINLSNRNRWSILKALLQGEPRLPHRKRIRLVR